MKNKIVVIGSSNIDFIMKMDHLPGVGETVTDAVFMKVYGGKGANQAVGAARAGGNVTFVTCTGDDDIATGMIEQYRKDGIDTSHIIREKGIATGTALIMIGEQGANYISVAPGANYRLSRDYTNKIEDVIASAGTVLLQYEILHDTIRHVLELCRKHGRQVIWNFAPARDFDRSLLPLVSILVVNESEASMLTGINAESEESVAKAADVLMSLGCGSVIITLGARGSYICCAGEKGMVSAFRAEAVDTTAAGDIYCGTLAVALSEGKTLAEAVRFASAAAAISVTRLGAQPSAPWRKEIDEFININK